MIRELICATLVLFSLAARSEEFKGFVEIAKDRSLYTHWQKAEPGQPTVVLLNGLTYSTRDWDEFSTALRSYGVGVLRYDPFGMGRTLEKDGPVQAPIPIERQARDLDLLTRALGFDEKLHLIGLSYGGGLAIAFARDYPHRVGNAFLMAPYTEPMSQQDLWIRSQIAWTRITFPFNPASDEDLYAFFLRQNVYYVYPYVEPSVLSAPGKPEAVFQMTQGIRQYDMYQAAQSFPPRSVHLVIAGLDQYIARGVLEEFWASIPLASRASKIVIQSSEHKIPEARPKFAASWIVRMLAPSR